MKLTLPTSKTHQALIATPAILLCLMVLPGPSPEVAAQRAADNRAIAAAKARQAAQVERELAAAKRCQDAIESRFKYAASVGLPEYNRSADGTLVIRQGFNGHAFGLGKVRTSALCTLKPSGEFTVRAVR